MLSDIHKKKRAKNLALLGIVMGWVALIWLVTMAKIAHSEPYDPFAEQRATHQAAMAATADKINERGAEYLSRVQATQAKIATDNAAHLAVTDKAKADWEQHWTNETLPARTATDAQWDAAREAHRAALEPKPEGWWQDWLSRHKL